MVQKKIESYPEAARLNRIFAGKPGGWLEAVQLPNEEYAKSEEECLKILLETHYPGFKEEEEGTRPSKNRRATKAFCEKARKIFTCERVRWVVANMFRSSLALGHVPEF